MTMENNNLSHKNSKGNYESLENKMRKEVM